MPDRSEVTRDVIEVMDSVMDSIIDCSEVVHDVEVSEVVPNVEPMDTEGVPEVESEGHIKTSNIRSTN